MNTAVEAESTNTTTQKLGGLPRWVEAPLALAGLLAIAPVLLLAAIGIRLSSKGPILFRQQRVGREGQPFTLYKFRSMRTAPPKTQGNQPQFTAAGDPRITTVGRLLRKTKVDELPELWNVVRGDMSFVGPRPEVPAYVDLQDPRWQRVLVARPGLTDPVTLKLRNEEDLLKSVGDQRGEFYAQVLVPYKLYGYEEYLRHRTARSDLGIIFRTLWGILVPSQAPPPTIEEVRAVAVASEAWPDSVINAVGSWKDSPRAKELRAGVGKDVPREPL